MLQNHSTLFTVGSVLIVVYILDFLFLVSMSISILFTTLLAIATEYPHADYALLRKAFFKKYPKWLIVVFHYVGFVPLWWTKRTAKSMRERKEYHKTLPDDISIQDLTLHDILHALESLEEIVKYQDGDPPVDHWRINLTKTNSVFRGMQRIKSTSKVKTSLPDSVPQKA